jgi:hypothetical protein
MTRLKAALFVSAIIFCSLLTYSGAWFFMAAQIREQIAALPEQAAKNGIVIDGAFSDVSGFPFSPAVHFSGRLRAPDSTLVIPDLLARGFPLPGQTIRLTAPQGAHLEPGTNGRIVDSDLWAAQFISITGIIPSPLPRDGTIESLKIWRDEGGQIVITSFALHKETLDVKGRGVLTLDDALQPAGEVHAEIGGYEDFIGYLKRKNLIKRKQEFFVQAALGVLARTNPATGARYLAADLTLQKQELFLGPLEVLELSSVQWPP